MQIMTPLGEAISRYLDLTSAELKLTAGNIANVDTPGYRTQGFDFQKEFASQLNALSPSAVAMRGVQARAVDGLVARPDGNNVSIDREGMALAKSQLKFKLGVQLLKNEISMISNAIHSGDSK